MSRMRRVKAFMMANREAASRRELVVVLSPFVVSGILAATLRIPSLRAGTVTPLLCQLHTPE